VLGPDTGHESRESPPGLVRQTPGMELVATWPAGSPVADVGAFARRVERLGFDVMHVPETVHDPFVVAALALTATERLRVRTSMVVAFPRSPMVVALSAWDLAGLSGGRFALGIGSQVRGNIVGRFSTSWSDPVVRMADYIASLRAIFTSFSTGNPLDHAGPHYRFDRLQPYFNPGPTQGAAPTIWTGGVNTQMTRMAGGHADGFVAHPTASHPAMLSAHTLPDLSAGATATGRMDAGPRVVAGPQPVTARTEAELADRITRRRRELGFLYSTPAYRRQLDLLGLGGLGEELSAAAAAGDWPRVDAILPDDVLRRVVPVGTYHHLPGVLAQWYDGMVDGLVLGVPDDPAEDEDLGALVESCRRIPTRDPEGLSVVDG
jgi:probable F420-dependent oxidoreductase